MDEVKFVLKGLAVAILVTVLLQLKVGGETLEMKTDHWVHHSSVGVFLNQSAEGGATLLRRGSEQVKKIWSGAFGRSDKKDAKSASWKIESRHQPASFEGADTEKESNAN